MRRTPQLVFIMMTGSEYIVDDEEQRGTREATDGASEIGHDSEHGTQHDDEQCGDAQRQRRGDPQGDEGQQQAQGPSALGG